MNKKAFTMVEMLVSLIVAVILILAIGVISSIALSSNRKQRVNLDTYSDIHYGFKLMENKIRSAVSAISTSTPGGDWRGARLEMDGVGFGVYRDPTSQLSSFVYVSNLTSHNCSTTAPSNCDLILKIPDPTNDPNVLSFTPTIVGNAITVKIFGINEKYPFNLAMKILKRSQ